MGLRGPKPGTQILTAPPSRRPTIADIHWAAGFIEGEGTFVKSGKPEKQNVGHCVAAYQCVNAIECLHRLREMFGGRVSQLKRRNPNPNGQEAWAWVLTGTRGRGVMLTLYGLMSAKRQAQIRKVLDLDDRQRRSIDSSNDHEERRSGREPLLPAQNAGRSVNPRLLSLFATAV